MRHSLALYLPVDYSAVFLAPFLEDGCATSLAEERL